MKSKFFFTTAIDYTNDVIHIGHAYEKLLTDAVVRYHRQKFGKELVRFLTGTDEHGNTNYKASLKKGVTPLEHVTEISQKDRKEIDALGVSYDRFIRTTEEEHKKIAQDFLQKSYDAGDIYKKEYEGFYCEGCESYKTLTELEDGRCPLHKTREIQKYQEENYFFKWSKYNDFLKDLLSSKKLLVTPEGKRLEMLALLEQGLSDIPISRPKFKLPWGIDVPFDDTQVIYVWFDALINYFTDGSKTGFWSNDTQIVHFVGKDINRWHSLLWPAMLKSAGYRLPDRVHVHGFMNYNGQKLSKSSGNVISPTELVDKYGVETVRYYLLKFGPASEDTDISLAHLEQVYNSELANGLGNTVSRLCRLGQNAKLDISKLANDLELKSFHDYMLDFRVDLALSELWKILNELDRHINEHAPWKITDSAKLEEVLTYELGVLKCVNTCLAPFIPETSAKISNIFAHQSILEVPRLFPRL